MVKFIIFLLGYCLYPFSFVVLRSKRKIAFGSFRNSFSDNAKYLFIYLSEHQADTNGAEIVWLSASKSTVEQVRSYGLNALFIGSLRGLWFALRAKYWYFSAYTSDILFFASGGATCINLWHGVGLKKIEFSITDGKLADRYVHRKFWEVFYHPETFRRPDYFLSSTEFQSVKFAEAFRIDLSQCLNIGYPRNSILLTPESERQQFIKKYEPAQTATLIAKIKQHDKTVVYMPTWRDSQLNIFAENMDLNALNRLMQEQNVLLILKPHANTKLGCLNFDNLENIVLFDNHSDIYTVLPYTDVLITDYSSILYDYILMDGKDVILYLYDLQTYINDRDFNYPFQENVVGKEIYNFPDLLACLSLNDYKIDETKRHEIINKFWGEKSQPKNVCKEIIIKTTNPS